MLLQANNVSLSLDALLSDNEALLYKEVARAFGVAPAALSDVRVVRKSVDARKKSNVHFVVNVQAYLDGVEGRAALRPAKGVQVLEPASVVMDTRASWVQDALRVLAAPDGTAQPTKSQQPARPLVVGAGPAGLFCALQLARAGLKPLLVERGKPVEERLRDVEAFAQGAALNPQSNIQFGEGGAGTFSDGKLTTGTKSPHARAVLQEFVACGAPDDILVDARPHIGTDYLPAVVQGLRQRIIEAGGEVRFSTQLTSFAAGETAGTLECVLRNTDTGCEDTVVTHALVLATGHSARDTYEMLHAQGVAMKRKPFAMGVRIEHAQVLINEAQYGRKATRHEALGAADYKLAMHTREGRGVYTFCMCPGGKVVAAASEEGGVCTNGMSNHARDGANANAAVLVEVLPADFPEAEGVLAGMYAQRALEQRSFQAAGGSYAAPGQSVGSFLVATAEKSELRAHNPKVTPSYPRGVAEVDLHDILPPFISAALEEALPVFGRKLAGFDAAEAFMTAPEARSSSPVQLIRDASTFQSVSHAGLYPAGEGAGHAGGIMSAACDGLRVADAIIVAAEVRLAAQTLVEGRPVVFPTDTVVGVGVSVNAAPNTLTLAHIKGRDEGKPIAWLVDSLDALDEYGEQVPAYARQLAEEHWPGACTLIVRANARVPEAYRSVQGTIGLRMPNSSVALQLIAAAGCPLATTSANIAGMPAVSAMQDLDAEFVERACEHDAAFMYAPEHGSGTASMIIDCTSADPHIIQR